MPAVRMFALYAAVALIINFFLQMTCFLGLFALDTKRQLDNRLDIFWCIKTKKSEKHPAIGKEGLLFTFFRDIYSPFLMKDNVRIVVLLGFGAWLCSSIAVLDKLHIGLEQELSMPEDSYMIDYFNFYQKYFVVGPPVYFMITDGYNYTDYNSQNALCSLSDCDKDSLPSLLGYMAENTDM
jgi:Niemann-Pick C1 protein